MPQRDKGDKRKRRVEKGREKGKGYLPQKDKVLPLDREETDMVHRKMAVHKRKGKSHIRMS